MTDQQRKQFGHIECRTSSKLLPAIAGAQPKQHVRSRSDLNVNPGVQLESIQELTRVHEHVPQRAPKVQHYTAQAIFDVEEYPKKIKRVRHPRNLSNVFNTDVDVNLSKKRKVKKAKRAQHDMILGNYEINNISSLLDNSVEESDFNIDTSRQDEVVPQPPLMKASPRQPPKTFSLNSKLAKAPKESTKRSQYVRNLQLATTTYQVPSDLQKPEPAVRVQLIKPSVDEKSATPESYEPQRMRESVESAEDQKLSYNDQVSRGKSDQMGGASSDRPSGKGSQQKANLRSSQEDSALSQQEDE